MTGGNGADTFYGTAGGNSLSGLPGDDLLAGRGGADTLVADEGKDWLNGGTGADTLNLNEAAAARDVVIYKTIGDSGLVFYLDDIVGFDPGALATSDRSDLSAIDANPAVAGNQAFSLRGSGGFVSAGGEVKLLLATGDTYVQIDNDNDATAEMIILVEGVTSLTQDDFLL